MSKAYMVVGLAGLVVLLGISTGVAEPTLRGYSGLLLVPTSDTLNRNQYNVSLNSSEISDFADRGYIFNYGLQDDIEAGLLWFHPEHGSSETIINLKHRFESGSSRRASLAVGVADLTDQMDTSVYVVGTKQFGEPVGYIRGRPVHMLRMHAGIGSGMFDDFFFGAEAQLGQRMTLMAEHINDQINIGARLRLWRNFTVDAGLLDMDDLAVSFTYNYPLEQTKALEPLVSEASSSSPRVATSTAAPPVEKPVEAVAVALQPVTQPQPVVFATTESSPVADSTPAPEAVVAQPQAPAAPPAEEPEAAPSVDISKAVVEIPLRGIYPDVASGHIVVPVRAVAEWLGFKVKAEFTAQGLQITVFAGAQGAEFYVGEDRATVNGKPTKLPAATYLQNNTVAMVPVEFFELLGVPTVADAAAGRALLQRHDVVGGVFVSK